MDLVPVIEANDGEISCYGDRSAIGETRRQESYRRNVRRRQPVARRDVLDVSFAPDVKPVVLGPDIQPRFERQECGHRPEIGSWSRIEATRETFAVVLEQPAVNRADQKVAIGWKQDAYARRLGFGESISLKRVSVECKER